MTEAQAIELISATFAAAWPAASSNVPYALDNRAIELPPTASFAALTITHTTAAQLTSGAAGSRFVDRNGWITVKLWGAAGAGRYGLAQLVGAVRAIFEMVNLPAPDGGEPLTTGASVTQEIGTDTRWFTLMVRTPFSYYETK